MFILYNNEVSSQCVISRTRFETLLSTIHFSDKEKCPEGDRLFKVRELVKKLNEKFKEILIPPKKVCIDESKVPFRGRLKIKHYIPNKKTNTNMG